MVDPDASKRAIGARLRAAREACALSQQAAATHIGVEKSTIVRWEQGAILPRDHWADVERVYRRSRMWLEFGVEVDEHQALGPAWSEFLDWYESAKDVYQADPLVLGWLSKFPVAAGHRMTVDAYKQLFLTYLATRLGQK